MKAILTLGIVVGLMMTFANLEVTAQKEIADFDAEQHEKNIEMCTKNLLAIGKSIQTYQKEHRDFPVWLSDLHPKHLTDGNALICPADEAGGKPIYSQNADPEMPVSYSYELNPKYRDWKTEQRKVYGNAMPLVRCRHHANEDFAVLNLSFSSRVYRSSNIWEYKPEEIYESIEKAIATLDAGIQ